MACDDDRVICVEENSPVFESPGIRKAQGSIEGLGNKANQKISCCQTTIQEFGRWMKGRFLVKGNNDQRIPKKCCDGEENVHRCERNWSIM